MFRYFYFITFGQEGVEPVNQLAVALEERRNSSYNTGRVDLLALEGLHDLQKFIINLGLVAELGLDLVEVEERVLDLRLYNVLMPPGGPGGRGTLLSCFELPHALRTGGHGRELVAIALGETFGSRNV